MRNGLGKKSACETFEEFRTGRSVYAGSNRFEMRSVEPLKRFETVS